jgi:lysophospholipase L1-like esterase
MLKGIRKPNCQILCIAIMALAFQGTNSCLAQGLVEKRPNPAVVPTDRLSDGWWADLHRQAVDQAKAHPETQLLLIGDSITNNYVKSKQPDEDFQPTWKTFYEPRKALNLGFSADTTAHVLWRLSHGEIDGLRPKVAMLMIGTNNISPGEQTAEDIESGIDAVVAELERRLPSTHILLLGILPREMSAEGANRINAVNHYLAECYGENPRVTYLDVGSIFFKDGVLNRSLFYDPRLPKPRGALHPDTNGQRMMAEAIEPTLAKLLGEPPLLPLSEMQEVNTAVIPVEWLEQDSYDWFARHHAELALQGTMKPQVVMIGDSITHFWGGSPESSHANGPNSWSYLFGDTPVLNMGFGWDRTQNVLWRLQQGEFEGISPKWVVVEIGTNNLTATNNARANSPAEIVEGIVAICKIVHERSPQSHVILMGILPRGESPTNSFRSPILSVNALLTEHFANDPDVTFLDIRQKLLADDGTLPSTLVPGGTHPNDAGYRLWADALREVMSNSSKGH